MNDVCGRRRSIAGDTDPGTWTSVKSSASGNRSHRTSSAFSPPRMPVSQSWTNASLKARLSTGSLFVDCMGPARGLLPRELPGARDALVDHLAAQTLVGQH